MKNQSSERSGSGRDSLDQIIWRRIGLVVTLIGGLLLVGVILRRWQKRRRMAAALRPPQYFPMDGVSPQIRGLSEEQAASLLPTIDREADIQAGRREFLGKAVRQTLFTVFNFNLFAMAAANFLLGNPIGALLNLVVLSIGMAVRVFLIVFTKGKMDEILPSLRPQASVIREGRLHSVDRAQIVPGDALTISNGDEILVNGELVGEDEIKVEEIDAAGKASRTLKHRGDALQAGSYCVQGRGVYVSKEAGWQRYQSDNGYQLDIMQGERTPFQRLIENVLRILLGVVLFFSALLVLDAVMTQATLVSQEYRQAFLIILGVAPTSLFMVLILKNIIGVLRASQRGALVYDPRSIEVLAQVNTLCISKESLVSGLQVSVDALGSQDGQESFSENLIRHILGDIVHSSPGYTSTLRMLAEALPGERRTIKEIAPFLERLGWFGITFEEADLQGTYILGRQEVLADRLVKDKVSVGERVEATVTDTRQGIGRFLQRFTRRNDNGQDDQADHPQQANLPTEDGAKKETLEAAQDGSKPEWRQRLRATLQRWVTPIEEMRENKSDQPEPQGDDAGVLFAYLPDPVPLFDRDRRPDLPDDLIPLARVQASEVVRPEAQHTIEDLLDQGMRIKILAADPPERVAAIAKELGAPDDGLSSVSGKALMDVPVPKKASETIIFGDLTPAQKAEIIKSLQGQDQYIMMVGSAVGDVAALRQADLAMVPKSGTQAALRLTDIVLLDDSIGALPQVFSTGQQMINGVLTTFKLNLSQVIAQLLLILLVAFNVLEQFPYLPAQAGVVLTFTIVIPNIFLVLWAAAGRVTAEGMLRQLIHFIAPTALTLTILVSGIYIFFSERSGGPDYARLAVTYALLLAGWLRVLFVQPPTPFWVGGAPLRGDVRVYRLVIGCALLLVGMLAFPFFQGAFHITLLASWADFFFIVLAVSIWAFILRAIWRWRATEGRPIFVGGVEHERE